MAIQLNNIDLSNLEAKSLFITGGTGFFGFWLLNTLKNLNDAGAGIEVMLLSRDPEKFLQRNPVYRNHKWLHWTVGDVVSYTAPQTRFDLFIHGAADTTPEAMNNPTALFEKILLGTRRVFEHAVASQTRRVLVVSSGAVYGEVPMELGCITEETATAPVTTDTSNAYGEAKRAAEMLGFCFARECGVETLVARCFAFFGIGIGQHLVLYQLISQALYQNEITINGDGAAKRSFLHGSDLAIWLLKLLVDGRPGEIYNVGSDQAYTILELARVVRDAVAPEKEIKVLGRQKKEYRMNYVPSVSKARSIGLDVWTPLEDMIKEQIHFTK